LRSGSRSYAGPAQGKQGFNEDQKIVITEEVRSRVVA